MLAPKDCYEIPAIGVKVPSYTVYNIESGSNISQPATQNLLVEIVIEDVMVSLASVC